MVLRPPGELKAEAAAEQRAALAAADAFARRCAGELDATRVILFGSRARHDWRRGSDVDLFVISERFEGMRTETRSSWLSEFWHGPPLVGCAAWGFTAAEFERGLTARGLIAMAFADGVRELLPPDAQP